MKKIIISIINLYQKMPLKSHAMCRYIPTCSEYAKECINEYGTIYGGFLAIKRVLRCNPLGGSGIDPVPIRKEKKWK